MKLLIELDEEYVKVIDKIKFLVGGRTDRKLQLEIIKAIKNGVPQEQEPNCSEIPTGSTTKNDSPKYCDRNICLRNEYNNIGCDECEVTKSQEPATKNDLGVDKLLAGCEKMSFEIEIFNKPLRVVALDAVKNIVKGLPSVTPQEPILDELRAEITTLQNRCYALTKGVMCRFCKYECEYKAESEG